MKIKRFKVNREIMDVLTRVQGLLEQRDVEGYLTGGFIRDAMMGRDSNDVDIVVGAPAMEVARDIADALEGRFVPLDEANEIARVVFLGENPLHIDVATMRGSISDDLALRDFTVDAMAIELKHISDRGTSVIDPYGGQQDLRAGIVRSISEGAFQRDPARLLRALRLAAECGFSIESETLKQIARHHQLITQVAAERIRDEFCLLLAVPRANRWLHLLDELGLLMAVLPELSACRGAEQPKEHFWDVLDHSIETVGTIEFLLRISDSEYFGEEILAVAPWSPQLEGYFEETVASDHQRKTLLKIAGLLHDIAKPQTRTIEEGGRMRFFGHSEEGTAIAQGIMERLRFSSRECEMVSRMIEYHLRPGQLARDAEMPTKRAIYRYFRDSGDVGIDIIFLNLADHLAARGPMMELEKWCEHAEAMAYVIDKRFGEEDIVAPPKLISGHDLVDTLGMSPGPEVGRLLEAVREAQAAGEVNTKEEALQFVRKHRPALS